MELLRARDAVAEVLAEMPAQIHDMLEHVTCQLLACPPQGVLADAKGLFFGQQQRGGPEDPSALVLARGVIQLYASNLDSAEEAQQALLHEVGHALGEDEWGVAELGLAS